MPWTHHTPTGHHVGYYPGAQPIHIKLLFDPADGRVLGAQAVGKEGTERRIDVFAVAIQAKQTVSGRYVDRRAEVMIVRTMANRTRNHA